MLIRHAIDLKVTMPAEFMQSIGPILAHEASEYFVADLEHWRFENVLMINKECSWTYVPVSMRELVTNKHMFQV